MIFILPYPPSGNHSTKHTRSGAHYTSPAAKAYKQQVKAAIGPLAASDTLVGPLVVVCEIYPPDRRRRDMDNAWKTAADAMTGAGVWMDDYQVADLRLVRMEVRKSGMLRVEITEIK